MRTGLFTIAALVCASALTINAQQAQTGDTTQRAAAAADQVIIVTGCLKAGKKDVPAAERAGVTEDYILTSVKMAPGSKVSGIGLVSTYQIEGIAEAELQRHLNHEVEVTGRITQAAMTETRPADDVPGFQATSLKMLSATCPAQ